MRLGTNSSPTSTSAALPRWAWSAVALLLAAHAWFAWSGKREWGVTGDEIAHVVAGRAYWAWDDYRLQPENGNLPQRWAALPATLAGTRLPPPSTPEWTTSDVWVLGHKYLFELHNDTAWILSSARAMNVLWSVGVALLVFLWARRLFGLLGGFVALIFCCADPTMLAHGALATSDMGMAFFFLAAVTAWSWHLRKLDLKSGLVSALVLGLACVAKFSAVLLGPMFVLIAAAQLSVAGSWPWPRLALSVGGHLVTAWIVIWAFFGFRWAAVAPGGLAFDHFIFPWPDLLHDAGGVGLILGWLRTLHALPEAFLYGFNHVLVYSQQRAAFLDGDYSIHGWVRFFPLAFLYKSPLALLFALPVSAAIVLTRLGAERARWRRALDRATPLLALLLVYGASALCTHLNIGQRHLLPLYPVCFIATGALGWRWRFAPWRVGALIGALLIGLVMGVARVHPHELAFFNAAAGGPNRGYLHLVDSSLDWGQDLPGLKKWLTAHAGDERVFLAYFGSDEPDHYRIAATRLPFVNGYHERAVWYEPAAGLYCVSATMLQAVYLPGRGDWTAETEREYQQLRALAPAFARYAQDPAARPALDRDASPEQWHTAWERFNALRFVRLCHYLRAKAPVARIGDSIFVYRLDNAEVEAACHRDLRALQHLIEARARR